METDLPIQRRENQSHALIYASMLPIIQRIGREHGYAIAVHGSMATDLDLIACPWTDKATDAETLAESMREAFSAYVCIAPKPGEKPHGRRCWSFRYWSKDLGFDDLREHHTWGVWIDLSVMPRLEENFARD